MDRINCFKCKYYYVTWDPKYPKGCKFFGFKSAGPPSATVYASAGAQCAGYEPREDRKKTP